MPADERVKTADRQGLSEAKRCPTDTPHHYSMTFALERDYRKMGVMMFGERPAFDGIMETLGVLEEEINLVKDTTNA
jgi:hypothetical protein